MKKCAECGGKMERVSGTHSGIEYAAYKCLKCSEEIMDVQQAKVYMRAQTPL